MHYVAELYYLDEGRRYSLGTSDFDADNDTQAGHKAEEWAVPLISQTIGHVIHLDVVGEKSRGAFFKKYGELWCPEALKAKSAPPT